MTQADLTPKHLAGADALEWAEKVRGGDAIEVHSWLTGRYSTDTQVEMSAHFMSDWDYEKLADVVGNIIVSRTRQAGVQILY